MFGLKLGFKKRKKLNKLDEWNEESEAVTVRERPLQGNKEEEPASDLQEDIVLLEGQGTSVGEQAMVNEGCEELEETVTVKDAVSGQSDVITVRNEDRDKRSGGFIEMAGNSIIGNRSYQQDAMFHHTRGRRGFAIICDGMGGLQGGNLASEAAVEGFQKDFLLRMDYENIPEFLMTEAVELDRRVFNLRDESGNLLSAGTTMVAIVVDRDRLYWISVGDSKIYIIRKGRIYCVTREHNYKLDLDSKLANKEISQAEYQAEISQGDALISFLGIGNLWLVDTIQTPFPLEEGDQVLLCSDGLYKSVSEEEILAVIQSEVVDSLQEATTALTDLAQTRKPGRLDNTTVILVQYHGQLE